ncbi:DNA-processing protein DprA [Aphanothece hegewaldii]|nr:DNA-processing protein DprA [Aphanothece hegewaldii]
MIHLDTQAILLLCASFGQNRKSETPPLTLSEYNILASWLLEHNMTPADLLDSTFKQRLPKITIDKLNSDRLISLLERGVMLSLAVEKWTNQGLWIIGRGENIYPKRLKQKLKHLAPSILYGIGNQNLLSLGGLAVVGSRDVDEAGLNYTQQVVETCAKEDIQVISGGARGVDQTAMLSALEYGGTTVGILADSLLKTSVNSKYRPYIRENKLTLISTYDPDAGFSIGNAMGRNKYIYSISHYALIVNSSEEKGGTWAGAIEALAKIKDVPVFVRMQGTISQGNQQLLKRGAKTFPELPFQKPLTELLATDEPTPTVVQEASPSVPEVQTNDIYQTLLPLILKHLAQPKDAKSLSETFNVRLVQMQDWLNRAVEEGKIKKNKKPVTYEINQNDSLLSLLDPNHFR